MQGYNVILIYSQRVSHILMCIRRKDPFLGLKNLIGGQIEDGESGIDAAYREMFEESGISSDIVSLTHVMDFVYRMSDCRIEVYAGRLTCDFDVFGNENELVWVDADENFFDAAKFAGNGNIGHLIAETNLYANKIFNLNFEEDALK